MASNDPGCTCSCAGCFGCLSTIIIIGLLIAIICML